MNIYLILIGLCVVTILICIGLLFYFLQDEKKLLEVSSEDLVRWGKTYTKEEIEDRLFQFYENILWNTVNEDYDFLKDSVSDQVYNKILEDAKSKKDRQEHSIISNIKKDFSKLISFRLVKELEVVKLWVRYSCIEYTMGVQKEVDENGKEILTEVVTRGKKEVPVFHEYILTFVKNRTDTEEIVCPTCGYRTNFLTSSHCIRCSSDIVPKKMHWVYVERAVTNFSNRAK